jgi:hypothetical protein
MNSKTKTFLVALHFVVGINALAGGYYGLSGAPNVPLEWLQGSPFNSFFVPSLFLFLVVAGSQLWAAIALAARQARAKKVSALSGLILLTWICAQVAIIGYVSWLQPAMGIAALTTIYLSWPRAD